MNVLDWFSMKNMRRKFYHECSLSEKSDTNQVFITYHQRPKKNDMIGLFSDIKARNEKIGIVIQGPLIKEDNFTVETVKLYQALFPDTAIVVSTWVDEDKKIVKELKNENCEIILNEKPHNPGISNINYQIVSSHEGILNAKRQGAKYILKTRTDQRIYAPNSGAFLCSLLDTFPVNKKYFQKARIIGISLNTFKFRPYGLSDMLIFGTLPDMELYWEGALDERPPSKGYYPKMRDFMNWRVCEIYLFTRYLKSIGRDIQWTLRDSWKAFAEHTCIIDKEMLDLFWNKYEKDREYRHLMYETVSTKQELSFRDWLLLYRGFIDGTLDVDENIIELNFGESINS